MLRTILLRLGVFLLLLLSVAKAQTFKSPLLIPTAFDPASVATGDFNQDGIPDLVYLEGGVNESGASAHVLLSNGDGSFATLTTIPLPTGVCGCYINVADVTHDGKLDLIIGGGTFSNGTLVPGVTVLPGNGDGTFGAPIATSFTVNVSGYPATGTRMGIGDINGDGAVDLVVPDPVNDQLYVLTGNSSGQFQLASTIFNGSGLSEAFLVDLNGDGKLDILALGILGADVTVSMGHGDGTFASGVNYSFPLGARNIVLTDLDGDGHLDVVSTTYQISSNSTLSYQVSVLLGKSDGTFGQPRVIVSSIQGSLIDVADYNGDGVLDLVVLNDVGIGILLGQGNLTYKPVVSYVSGPSTYNAFAAAAFNRNGHRSIAMAVEGGIVKLEGNGDGTFPATEFYDLNQPVGATAIADFNKDGNPDIAVTVPANYPRLLLGKGDGTFQLAADQNTSYDAGPAGSGAVAADFNGDGDPDLLALSDTALYGFGTPTLYLGNGGNSFAAPDAEYSGSTAVADFNSDHRADMIAINAQSIVVSLAEANGSFNQVTTALRNPTFAKLTAIGDLNGDGKPDAIVADNAGLEIWLGNGDGTFSYHDTIGNATVGGIVAGDFGSSAIADLDGDGKADLILGPNVDAGQVLYILYGNGDGTFQAPATLLLSHTYTSLAVADVNGDRKPDLVLNDAAGIAVIRNLGSRKFAPEFHYVAGGNIGTVSVTDVNRDGYPDMVVANSAGTTVTVLLNEPHTLSACGILSNGALSISPEPSPASHPFTATLTLTAPTAGDPALTGTVGFSINGAFVADVKMNSGTASFTETQSLNPGGATISATYNGDENYCPETFVAEHTITPPVYVSSTALTVTPAQLLVSQTVRMQVSVTASGGPTPGGSVTLLDGSQTLGAAPLDATGNAYFDTALLGVGTHSIVAKYSGEIGGYYTPFTLLPSASAPVSVMVTDNSTATTVSPSPASPTVGTVVTLTAAVSSASGMPFGGVTFYDGATQLGTSSLDAGKATLSTASLSQGTHSITATFNQNATYGSSTSQAQLVTIQAVPASLIPTFISVAQTHSLQDGMTLSAQVTSGSGTPGGQVSFLMDGANLGTANVGPAGTASLTLTRNPGNGLHTFYASFAGAASFGPSVSPALRQSWLPASSDFSLTLNTNVTMVSDATPGAIFITIAAPAGDRQSVSLACVAGVPQGYACAFSPASVAGSGSSTLSIRSSQNADGTPPLGWKTTLAVSLSLILVWPLTRGRRSRWCLSLLVCISLIIISGCGTYAHSARGKTTVLVMQASSGDGLSTTVHSAQVTVVVAQ